MEKVFDVKNIGQEKGGQRSKNKTTHFLRKELQMKRIVLLAGAMLVFGAAAGYGQENADAQKTAQSQEDKTFDKPLEKRVEEAVSGMEPYGEEVYKEIESMEGKEEKNKRFFSRLQEYIANYVRDSSIKELLALEAQILKKGEGPDSIYGWFFALVHGTVLKLADYDPRSDIPISDKILEIIQDESIDDYVRSKYVIDVEGKIRDLNNRKIEVSDKTRETIYPTLIKIIEDMHNSSKLRASSAGALASIGRNSEKIAKYIMKLLDDKDDLVKMETILLCSLNDNDLKEKAISILKNKQQYSKKVIEEVRKRLTREPAKTREAIPYLLDMLRDTKDKNEFIRLADDLQNYNDTIVLGPIIKKFKELGLEKDTERKYYFENSLLLDYLPKTKDEDKLLVLNLIYDTSGGVVGDVYTPPHFDKAVNLLRDYTLSPNEEIQLVSILSYGKMLDALRTTWLKPAQEEGMSKLDDIKKILLDAKEKTKDLEITEEIDSSLNKIEKLKSR